MAEPPSGGTRGADVVPALRDDHGQRWPWPPTRGPEDAAAPRGTWLVFLPGAFTPVCTDELGWIGALAEDVAVDEVAVRVVSCDAAPVLRRVREELALPEPLTLLSDFWPHGAACRALDVFDAETGRPRRVSVLLDADGVEERLRSGGLACPGCAGVLTGWGRARARAVRGPDGAVALVPRRSR